MRKRRNMETFNLSFLDVVCCGFGAVILLLVITKIYEPISIQESKVNMEELVVELERQLNELKGESTVLNEEMQNLEEQILFFGLMIYHNPIYSFTCHSAYHYMGIMLHSYLLLWEYQYF